MEILVGNTAGFCYGVKRAVDGAKTEVSKSKGKICCLGEIVHNKQVVNDLKQRGLIFVEYMNEMMSKTIIRAHGTKKEIYDEARKGNIELKDYTCPNVLKIHKIAEEYAEKGYYIFLCGSKNHPENIGTISYCGNNSCIIEKEEDTVKALVKLEKSGINKLLVISQTTYSLEKFYVIEEIIRNELPKSIELVVKNTICRATELRQKETEELSKKVEYMIIIGGKNSSNTRKLYEIAKKNCKNCICIETDEGLNIEEIKKYSKIGVMAGASTPQESIERIINKIKQKWNK